MLSDPIQCTLIRYEFIMVSTLICMLFTLKPETGLTKCYLDDVHANQDIHRFIARQLTESSNDWISLDVLWQRILPNFQRPLSKFHMFEISCYIHTTMRI